MPRSSEQKKKILVLLRYLQRQSDEEHLVTMQQILEELERNGIQAERKSVYDDLRVLEELGFDLIQRRGKTPGYAIGARDFQLPELQLLVDSIQSAKFITEKKTMELIAKLESLVSVHDGRKLQRQVYVRGRVKSMNESVYYNVDAISDAIARDRAIRFRYYEITVSKQRRYRRGGAYYRMSPYALIWDDENYYLLAWDAEAESFKHFRVDKMTAIAPLEEPREGKEAFRAKDMSVYSQQVFGMFAGEATPVRMRFAAHLAGAVVDRFGRDTILVPDGEDAFIFTAKVAVSPQFFAWLFGFGREAEILSPPHIRHQAGEAASSIATLYAGDAPER